MKVREVRATKRQSLDSSFQNLIRDFDNDRENSRIFFVHLRPRNEIANETTPDARPSPVTPSSAERLHMLNQAVLLVHEGEDLLARNIYSFLLSRELRDWDAMRGLGNCLLKLGEVISAKKCFQTLRELGGMPLDTFRLAQCQLADRADATAFVLLTELTSESLPLPDQIEYFRDFGNCCHRMGELERAELLYSQGLQLAPRYLPLLVTLGTLKLRQSQYSDAKQLFETVLSLDPRHSIALGALGFIELQVGSPILSERFLSESLAIDPQNLAALTYFILLSERMNDFQSLEQHLLNYIQGGGKDVDLRYTLAVILFNQRKWRDCQRELSAVLMIDPEFKKARALREEIGLNRIFSS